MQDSSIYVARRAKLISILGNDGIVIVPNANEIIRNGDSHYQYRFDSYFYYLTGFTEPNAVLVIDLASSKSILFCQNKDPEREIWDGYRYGPKQAGLDFNFDESYSIDTFRTQLNKLLSNQSNVYYTLAYNPYYDEIIMTGINQVKSLVRSGVTSPSKIIDINKYIANMRIYKDEHDIAMIRESCRIASLAHIKAMQMVTKAQYEYQVEAKLLETFYANGARYPAYTPIIAGGANSCILHYVNNNQALKPGELLLVDAGCEYLGYASDITRTYPINGKFSKAQQAIYEIVLQANKEAINAVIVGPLWTKPQEVALKVLISGLIDLKLLSGTIEDNIENKAYRQFYMHGIGHYLGLDVHDAGEYKIDDNWIKFAPGMCSTIEPGIYIQSAKNVPEEYWNIGIRIEDDILVTSHGVEVLTRDVPKEIKDIEYIINKS